MSNKENKKNKKCDCNCSCQDQVCQIQQRIFEREVDEELRQEHLMQMWKKYRFLVFGAVICVILGTILTEWYQDYQMKVRVSESDQYEDAVIASVKGETEMALTNLKLLSDEGKTGYRYLADLKRAGILIKQDKKAEGLSILKKVMDDTSAPQAIKEATTLIFVGQQLDHGQTVELKQYLSGIVSNSESPFFVSASELMGLLYMIPGETKEAVKTIETALQHQSITPQQTERLKMVLKEIKK